MCFFDAHSGKAIHWYRQTEMFFVFVFYFIFFIRGRRIKSVRQKLRRLFFSSLIYLGFRATRLEFNWKCLVRVDLVQIVLYNLSGFFFFIPPRLDCYLCVWGPIGPCKHACVRILNVGNWKKQVRNLNRRWVTSNWHFSLYSTVRRFGVDLKELRGGTRKKKRGGTKKLSYHDFQSFFFF